MAAPTTQRRLREIAEDQYGYVTTGDAAELGVPTVEVGKLAHRGVLEHVSRGLYRFADIRHTDRDAFMEAVLWAGPDAMLTDDAVLALLELGLVNPAAIRVATTKRVRKTQPRADIEIVPRDVVTADRTQYFGIPATKVARALLDARTRVMPTRLRDAAAEAYRQGLMLRDEYDHVLAELEGV